MAQRQQETLQPFSLSSLLPPFHEITLPSAGYFDVNVPANLHVRGLTVKELKHITATGKLDRKIFDNTLASCIKETIDIGSLTVEDYNYIVYMIRLHSNGSKVSAVKSCDNNRCGKQFRFDYDISDIAQVTYATDTLEKTKTVLLPRLKREHEYSVYVEVKRLTRKDVLGIELALRSQTESAAKENSGRKIFPLIEYLKAYIVSITGLPVDVPKEQLLDVLSAEDTEVISTAFESSVFGVTGTVTPECPYCHEVNDYEIPFTDIFFL